MAADANRLADATSPYLMQHASNPVAWQPWDAEALALSRREDRPILLSIGFSTCHWCHEMARDCFEDTQIAAFMNEHFVCVKVDREERPDIDQIYSLALRSLAGRNGWPATLFLTPDLTPFFGGTFFPAKDSAGRPGFLTVLRGVDKAWREQRATLMRNGARAAEKMLDTVMPASCDPPTDVPDVSVWALERFGELYDHEFGGFGDAPKFPRAPVLCYLARRAARHDARAADMLAGTLSAMARGAIRDQIDGGFHRYAMDRAWRRPHFEKTLYDNAQLAWVYAVASKVLPHREEFRLVGEETFEFILRGMRDERGAFIAGLDADGESGEGSYYRWTYGELAALAGKAVADRIRRLAGDTSELIWLPAIPADGGVLARLRAARRGRQPPARDDKILASWNGLAIAALADAGRLLGNPGYVRAAARAAEVVLGSHRCGDGRLARSWRSGRVSGPGFLDDYAMLGLGCLALHEATLQPRWLRTAQDLAAEVRDRFMDAERGLAYLSDRLSDPALIRGIDTDDTALPSATAAAAELLWRVGRIAGDDGAVVLARRVLDPVLARGMDGAEACAATLAVLDRQHGPTAEVALVGNPVAESTVALARALAGKYRPGLLFAAGPGEPPGQETTGLLAGRPQQRGRAVAYVCCDSSCSRPLTEPGELAAELDGMCV